VPKAKVGYMKCETRQCLNSSGAGRVVVYENEKGTLTYRCDECGAHPYVHKGTGQHAAWMRDVEKAPGSPPPAPAPTPAPAAPAPAEKTKPAGSLLG
jgi:hypothetical protein